MAEAALVILYVIFCLLVAVCGIPRRIGFFATFILSVVFTPVLVLLVLMMTAPARGYGRDIPAGRK
jgi:hypothetical protein